VFRRLPGKAPKRWNIEIFLRVGIAARQDGSAHKNVKLFLREPSINDRAYTANCNVTGFFQKCNRFFHRLLLILASAPAKNPAVVAVANMAGSEPHPTKTIYSMMAVPKA
jgi:hypothetical protein